ncbi:hypothetical protein JOD20_003959 [Herpetosiphon giganteus]|nr:hypothetical protein [Herpetosiphon giganteus]
MLDYNINGVALVGENKRAGEVWYFQSRLLPRLLVGDK